MNRSCQATMPLVVLAIVLSGSINLAQDSLQETLSALSPTPEIKPPQQQPTLKIDADEVPDITGPWKIRLPDLEAPTLAHIRRVRGKQPDEVYALTFIGSQKTEQTFPVTWIASRQRFRVPYHHDDSLSIDLELELLPSPQTLRVLLIFTEGAGSFTKVSKAPFEWHRDVTAPEITGSWRSDAWGSIELQRLLVTDPNGPTYAGTYSGDGNAKPGQMQLKWVPQFRQFQGTWREGETRSGKLSIRLLPNGNTIRGSWTIDVDFKIDPDQPVFSDLEWRRGNDESTELDAFSRPSGNRLKPVTQSPFVVPYEPPGEPIQATVLIRITNDSATTLGSGTIIESDAGRATILTSNLVGIASKTAVIEVGLYAGASQNELQLVSGSVLKVNREAGLGLVSIRHPTRLPAVQMSRDAEPLEVIDRLFSFGCTNGEAPSRDSIRVTSINKYQGAENLQCTGVPENGRAGGGLFRGNGLVGVCIAADPQNSTGVYTSQNSIARFLEDANLKHLVPAHLKSGPTSDDWVDKPAIDAGAVSTKQPVADTTPVPNPLTDAIAELEGLARGHAEQFRRQADRLGRNHPDVLRHRQDLEKTLAAALDLKFQLERRQLEQLQERLSRMRDQLQFRQTSRDKILKRHALELLEEDGLRWSPEQANVEEPQKLVPKTSLPQVTMPKATNADAGQVGSAVMAKMIDTIPRDPLPYRLRPAGPRSNVAIANGASAESERAVQAALRWLAKTQEPGGNWSSERNEGGAAQKDPMGHERPEGGLHADTGITGLATLAFLGAGSTPEDGPHQDAVLRAIGWLIAQQKANNGYLGGPAARYDMMYCHAMATVALAEALAMQSDADSLPGLRDAVRAGVRLICEMQNQDGGWRYGKGGVSDMSVTGWQLTALWSASNAGIRAPDETLQNAIRFLAASSQGPQGGLAGYQTNGPPTPSMTAEALACRQLFGVRNTDRTSQAALEYLLANPPRMSDQDECYWYFGSLALFQSGDPPSKNWNAAARDILVQMQIQEGAQAGSWPPRGKWGGIGGRVFSTAMSTLTLEVYYRFPKTDGSSDDLNAIPGEANSSGLRRSAGRFTAVEFVSPKGMQVEIGQGKEQVEWTAPGVFNFSRTNIPLQHPLSVYPDGKEGDSTFSMVLEVSPADTRVETFLATHSIPIRVTDEDLEQLKSRNRITKVFYLTKASTRDDSSLETLVSTRLDPGIDPIQEAGRRGSIVLVCRFGELRGTQQHWHRRLEPLSQQIQAAKQTINELEPLYDVNAARTPDLQRELDKLWVVEETYRREWNKCEEELGFVRLKRIGAVGRVQDLLTRVKEQEELLQSGGVTATEFDLNKKATEQALADLEQVTRYYQPLCEGLEDCDTWDLSPSALIGTRRTYPPHADIVWLEAAIQSKFDVVQFRGLKLPFGIALRVRESNERFCAGDLIVELNYHSFDSPPEAIDALRQRQNNDTEDNATLLRGGLAGKKIRVALSKKQIQAEYFNADRPEKSIANLEVRLQRPDNPLKETRHVEGICVSLDGLYAIPLPDRAFVPGEPIRMVGTNQTGRVVGTDEKHGLSLVQFDRPNLELHWWLKCRTEMPTRDQHLTLWQFDQGVAKGVAYNAPNLGVYEFGTELPDSLKAPDAFTVNKLGEVPNVKPGAALISPTSGELQGIVTADWEPSGSGGGRRLIAIPALFIERMVQEYRNRDQTTSP